MKKFTDIKRGNKTPIRRINEQEGDNQIQSQQEVETKLEDPKANLPELGQSAVGVESSESPIKLFSKLFESREMAHIYHLQTKGSGAYASHVALGSYYDGVLEFIDELIEVYQGQYSIIEGYDVIDTKETNSKDKVEYFEELVKIIKEERKTISVEDTHLHNIVDEVVALIYKTLYKLKYLK